MFMSNSLRITPRIRKEITVIINCVSSLNVISLVMGKLETNRDVSASNQRETEEDDDSV